MRLEISRRAHLALQALIVLADDGCRIKGADLAVRIGTSTGFLAQAMKPMVVRGWVQSETGRTGGYIASFDSKSISVLDVIEAVEGKTDENMCVLRGGPCPDDPCAVHAAWLLGREVFMGRLELTPISALPVLEGTR